MKNLDTLQDLYTSEEFMIWQDQNLGNQLFLTDPDRANRIQRYSEDGAIGSTHREIIQDWRDFLSTLEVEDEDFPEDNKFDLTQAQLSSIEKEIDECEKYHIDNKSIDSIIN